MSTMPDAAQKKRKIAVLLPCYNEEITIAKVISDFRRELPEAEIWVFDNNSTDRSVELAQAAGARIQKIFQQGKGHVMRRMFQKIEADCYVIADSDDTYPAEAVHELILPILNEEADMVIGDRLSPASTRGADRPFHGFGNWLVQALIHLLFAQKVTDVMTGYRAFSRTFVKSCPILSTGFEIETEFTLHALDKRMRILEIPIAYRSRPSGSQSKLNTFSDGFRVLKTIFYLFKDYRPLLFFGLSGIFLVLVAIALMIPIFLEFFQTGSVPRFPTLIGSTGLMGLGISLICCGIILDSCKRYADQLFELLLMETTTHKG